MTASMHTKRPCLETPCLEKSETPASRVLKQSSVLKNHKRRKQIIHSLDVNAEIATPLRAMLSKIMNATNPNDKHATSWKNEAVNNCY